MYTVDSNKTFILRISPPGIRVVKCLSGVRWKSHAPFLEGGAEVILCSYSTCDKKLNSGLHNAILFVQDIPTAACVSGNGFVCSLQDNVEKTGNLIRSICKGKVVMEKRKLNYHKGRNVEQAKSVDTLAPKGKEPGYIGSIHDITNELSVPGL